jgi:hypothetical protein
MIVSTSSPKTEDRLLSFSGIYPIVSIILRVIKFALF